MSINVDQSPLAVLVLIPLTFVLLMVDMCGFSKHELRNLERSLGFFANTAKLGSLPVFFCYLCMVFLSPVWKRLSSPLDLKQVMVFYNIIAVLLSAASTALLAYGIYDVQAIYGWATSKYIDYGLLVYTISKNVELLDTVFMILRHKARQISFLHVFHHSTILILGNYSYAYTPYPPVAFGIGLNSLVHVFLYSYYALTAMSANPSVAWKKHLTQLQIIQFFIDLVFAVVGYVHYNFCVYSIMYCLSMIVLFSNFYYIAYMKRRPDVAKKSD